VTTETAQKSGLSWLAVIVGTICAEVISFFIGFVLGYLFGSGQITPETYASLILFTGAAGYFLGGLVAAAIARRRGILHGFVTGLLGIALALILGAVMRQTLTPVGLGILALSPIAGSIGGGITGK